MTMKKIFLTLIPLLFILTARAQMTDSSRNSNDKVFTSAERAAEYPGGLEKFYRFLGKTLRYPAAARENNTQGKVLVSMVVEKDGSLSNVKVQRGIGDGCDEEAVRLIKLSSPWKPGIQNSRPVRVMYTVPVSFVLAN